MILVMKAEYDDLKSILDLQYLAYQSEAALFGTKDIPPLKQTLEEVVEEYGNGTFLKMVSGTGDIIGSVRAREKDGTVLAAEKLIREMNVGDEAEFDDKFTETYGSLKCGELIKAHGRRCNEFVGFAADYVEERL